MNKTVIVHGPQACGKTRHAETLRRHFACREIIDNWLRGDAIVPGALHLTYTKPSPSEMDRAMIIPFGQAMHAAGLIREMSDG